MIHHLGALGERRLNITSHALDRYIERVRPTLDRDQALDDLRRLLNGAPTGPAPTWMRGKQEGPGIGENLTVWIHLTDDIALAVDFPVGHPPLVVTCIARGGRSDAQLARNSRWRRNRALERNRRKSSGPRDERPRRRDWNEEAA